jgi:peptidoglycan LD-endopeptidase CwlK
MLEAISEQRLSSGNQTLATKVRAAHDELFFKTGNGFRVAECMRSFADSDADYAKGRTAPGPVITNASGGHSWHNFGLAVDVYPFVAGDAGNLDWNATDPKFKLMVDSLKAQGLVWGGDWTSIKDYPHFQLAEIPVSPTDADREAYKSGGMQAVWKLYGV